MRNYQNTILFDILYLILSPLENIKDEIDYQNTILFDIIYIILSPIENIKVKRNYKNTIFFDKLYPFRKLYNSFTTLGYTKLLLLGKYNLELYHKNLHNL